MCDATDTPAMESQPRLQKERVVGAQNKLCVKCKAAKPSVSIRRSLYCRNCFVRSSVTKFRTALSKSRKRMPVTAARARVMVALSGGATSSAMLQLMADYQRMELKGYAAEHTYDSIVAGHVDESALFSGYDDAQICDIAAAVDVECRVARLEDVFELEGDRAALLELVHATIALGTTRDQFCVQLTRGDESTPAREQLRALFAGLGSATDREDMLDIIKSFLLARLARQAQCELLLLGDSGTRIASKLVSLTSRGRGFSLPLEVGAETPFLGSNDVVAYRPMRDLIMKEIAFFNLWTGQSSVVVPTFTTGAPETASIDRLTEAFVVGLDRDFVSTVSTVCRTVQKLEQCPEALTAAKCILCSMPAELNAQAWRNRLTVNVAPNERPSENVATPSADIQSPLSSFDVTARLCYSCQSLLHFAKPGVALPVFCLDNYREQATASPPSDADNDVDIDADSQQRRESLRQRIEEFFI
ncbi:Cytoplasmic tRNA 2-thiolation protein 2 [Coemansia sp. RSA 2673]|nr:Cytoplasmic tRNA 2-thiolation protein 2 [Coemansia sp. RSA 2673]